MTNSLSQDSAHTVSAVTSRQSPESEPLLSPLQMAMILRREWAIRTELLEALEQTWSVLRAAGLSNLTRGVQLGQTSWYVKICDAEAMSDAAIAKAEGQAK